MKISYSAAMIFIAAVFAASSASAGNNELLKLGLKYAEAGKTDEAIVILNESVDENPSAAGFLALGIMYLEKNDLELSYANLREALSRDPNSAPARYTLAMLYEKKGMNAEALEEWKRFLAVAKKKKFRDIAEKHIEQLEAVAGGGK